MRVAEPLEWRLVRDTLLRRRRRSRHSWAFKFGEKWIKYISGAPEMLFFAREVWGMPVGGDVRARPDRTERGRFPHPRRTLRRSAARA
jgi:hypothetical protein